MPHRSAISSRVSPSKYASSIALRCSSLRLCSASRMSATCSERHVSSQGSGETSRSSSYSTSTNGIDQVLIADHVVRIGYIHTLLRRFVDTMPTVWLYHIREHFSPSNVGKLILHLRMRKSRLPVDYNKTRLIVERLPPGTVETCPEPISRSPSPPYKDGTCTYTQRCQRE